MITINLFQIIIWVLLSGYIAGLITFMQVEKIYNIKKSEDLDKADEDRKAVIAGLANSSQGH